MHDALDESCGGRIPTGADRLAALVPPPRIHRRRRFGTPVRTTAYRKFR